VILGYTNNLTLTGCAPTHLLCRTDHLYTASGRAEKEDRKIASYSTAYQGELHRALLHPGTDGSEAGVHLAWGRTENERDDCVPSNFDVLEGSHDMYFTRCIVSVKNQAWKVEKRVKVEW